MSSGAVRALIWGAAVALYLRFGLEPTGWLFYEASFALGVDWLYYGYSGFRGAGYAFGLWSYQSITCLLVGLLVAALVYRRARKQEAT